MIKISFTSEEIDALHQQRIHHPHPRVRLKMEALYLKSQSFAHQDIARLCRISKSTLRRYLQDYAEDGIDKLGEISFYRPQSELEQHREVIAAAFGKQPPATVAEAAARIKELTGLERKPTQVRAFIKSLGMKPLKVGTIPAKADVLEQEAFKKKQLEPRIAQAQAGERALYFVDAAHFVFGPFLGILWCFQRLFVKAPSGRQRLNVLAALDAISHELVTLSNLSYINAGSVCELLRLLAARHVKTPITVVLDNARYQRCKLVQELAQSLGIELLFTLLPQPQLDRALLEVRQEALPLLEVLS
jgi:transposase